MKKIILLTLLISSISFQARAQNLAGGDMHGNWETCCLDTNLRNYYSQGVTWTCDIPNPAIIGGNTNPKFIITPDTLFFPIGFFSNSNFSCTDPDGDSLVYSLIQSYDTTHNRIKPYSLVPFKRAYDNPNIIGPGSSININKNTGIVTARPAIIGKYLITVKCEEFRNGIKIGEVTRNFIMIAGIYPLFSISKTNLNSQIKIYPNPSNGEFRIEKSNEIKSLKVEVYDIYGKIIFSKISNNNLTNINLNNIAKGFYTVKLIMDNTQTVKRIVVN
jgi:hypothetical protein